MNYTLSFWFLYVIISTSWWATIYEFSLPWSVLAVEDTQVVFSCYVLLSVTQELSHQLDTTFYDELDSPLWNLFSFMPLNFGLSDLDILWSSL